MQLNYQDLKKYMTIVYELEEEICFQNELMAKLQQKISSLGISRNINPPKTTNQKNYNTNIFICTNCYFSGYRLGDFID